MATAELLDLMTAEEFGKRPDPGYPEELVRGRVITMTVQIEGMDMCARKLSVFSATLSKSTIWAESCATIRG